MSDLPTPKNINFFGALFLVNISRLIFTLVITIPVIIAIISPIMHGRYPKIKLRTSFENTNGFRELFLKRVFIAIIINTVPYPIP